MRTPSISSPSDQFGWNQGNYRAGIFYFVNRFYIENSMRKKKCRWI